MLRFRARLTLPTRTLGGGNTSNAKDIISDISRSNLGGGGSSSSRHHFHIRDNLGGRPAAAGRPADAAVVTNRRKQQHMVAVAVAGTGRLAAAVVEIGVDGKATSACLHRYELAQALTAAHRHGVQAGEIFRWHAHAAGAKWSRDE
jgi:hypothetical protein